MYTHVTTQHSPVSPPSAHLLPRHLGKIHRKTNLDKHPPFTPRTFPFKAYKNATTPPLFGDFTRNA